MNAFLKNNLSGFLVGALITVLIAVATAYGVIVSGVISPCADDPTPPFERWAAKTSLRAYLGSHTPNTTNPLKASSSEDLKAGAKLYVNNCAFCHGYARQHIQNCKWFVSQTASYCQGGLVRRRGRQSLLVYRQGREVDGDAFLPKVLERKGNLADSAVHQEHAQVAARSAELLG